METIDFAGYAQRMRDIVLFAEQVERIRFSIDAAEFWCEIYPVLTAEQTGLLGKVISRSDPQTIRIACLYALADQSAVIEVDHLRAALAVWQFCEDSARYIFGNSLGDPLADTILQSLRATAPAGLTRTQISRALGSHADAKRVKAALKALAEKGVAHSEVDTATGGRPLETWYAETGGASNA